MLRQIQTAAFPPSMSIQTGLDLYKLYAYKCFVCSLRLKCSERSSPTSQSFPMQEQSRQYYVALSSIYKAFTTMLFTPYCESIVFGLDNPQVVPVSGLLWLKTVVQLSWLRVFFRVTHCCLWGQRLWTARFWMPHRVLGWFLPSCALPHIGGVTLTKKGATICSQ